MTTYPLPENVTNILDLGTYTNQTTDGIFGMGFIIVIFAVMFMRFHGFRDTQDSLVGASFIAFFVSVFFRMFGWINDYVLYICIIVLIGSLIWRKFGD